MIDTGLSAESEELRIWLLGTFRIAVGTRVIDDAAWRLQRPKSLIKLLALAPGHRLHREQITDMLWRDLLPQAAANNFHQALHTARRILEPTHSAPSFPSRYLSLQHDFLVLHSPSILWIDVEVFETDATEVIHEHNLANCRTTLELYTGDLLPDDRYETWTFARRETLREKYLALLTEFAQLLESNEDYLVAIETFERVVASDPAHEEAQVGLMRLFAQTDQRHQALQQYRRLREALQQAFGAEPSEGSEHLYRSILLRRYPARPSSHDLVAPEAKQSRTDQLILPPSGGGSPGLQARTHTHNLPTRLNSFLGREREMIEVKDLLSSSRLLTLTGVGGCGKTRLALEIAADLLEYHPDGTWLVDVATLTTSALVPQAVATVLQVREESGQALTVTLLDTIGEKHLFLVLDNCEHFSEATAALAEKLLRGCPNLHLLITSREPLHIPGEKIWRVLPLSLPDLHASLSLENMMHCEAVQLFVDRARLSLPDFSLTLQNAQAIAQLCRRLDGIPLAIELLAARIPILSVEQMLARLTENLSLLTNTSRTVPSRHKSFHISTDWSYVHLHMSERTLFKRLSIFAGGFTLEAAEAVCAGAGIKGEAVFDLLARLVDKSLVIAETQSEGTVRYRLLETLRRYGWERLMASKEKLAIHRARSCHATYYLMFVETAEPELWGEHQNIWLDRLETEYENVCEALSWCELEPSAHEVGLRLAGAMWVFWNIRGFLGEGRQWLEKMLSHEEKIAGTVRAKALNGAGNLASGQEDYLQAVRQYEASLALQRELGDTRGIATVLLNLAWVAHKQGCFERAALLCEESLTLFRVIGDKHGLAFSLLTLGRVASNRGNIERAKAWYWESAALLRELGDTRSFALVLNHLGQSIEDEGDDASAYVLFSRSLMLNQEVRDKRGIITSLNNLAKVARKQEDFERAAALYEESLMVFQKLGDRPGIAQTLEALAELTFVRKQHEGAAYLFGAAEALRGSIGIVLPPDDRTPHDQHTAGIDAALDKATFKKAWVQGETTRLEQVIDSVRSKTVPGHISPVPAPLSQSGGELSAN